MFQLGKGFPKFEQFALCSYKRSASHLFVAGLAWAAVTTEGVLIYSSDSDFVFDPYLLDVDVTTDAVSEHLAKKDYVKGM